MKRTLILSLAAVALTTNLGCRNSKEQANVVVWDQGQGTPPSVVNASQFEELDRSLLIQHSVGLGVQHESRNEIVEHAPQKWGAARVEGGSLQKVSDDKGQLLFVRADFLASPESDLDITKEEVQKLHDNRFAFLEKAKLSVRQLKDQTILGEPEVVIVPHKNASKVFYAIQVIDVRLGQVVRFLITPEFKVRSREVVSSSMVDVQAVLFAASPQRQLQEVMLKRLVESGKVESATHSVTSQTPHNATPENAPFRFPLDDPRFDQVQVFYYVQQGIEFFAKEMGFAMPTSVRIETSVGYPDKTNAAFALGSQIWLGRGDGQEYKLLAQDSSVVLHELSHVLIHFTARLPTQGEGGSLNEGFADYFSATQLNAPSMGGASCLLNSCKRNIDSNRSFAERNGGLYHDSLIVSGTLWELRAKLGKQKANALALKTLTRLGPAKKLADFSYAVKLAAKNLLTAEELAVLNSTLQKRLWPD